MQSPGSVDVTGCKVNILHEKHGFSARGKKIELLSQTKIQYLVVLLKARNFCKVGLLGLLTHSAKKQYASVKD